MILKPLDITFKHHTFEGSKIELTETQQARSKLGAFFNFHCS